MIGEGNTLDNVKRILKRKGVMDHAVCAGSVPADDVPEYLAACDILVAPHIRTKTEVNFLDRPQSCLSIWQWEKRYRHLS